ncbi:MAG TPA: tetratricopeptide repeat protein, partial [Myxococcales bacterium]|nr:tetratricopeptide repeat protein [Myxococcales bacterium]
LFVLALALPACRDPETALARGDRLWADSNYIAALAEYRLSHARRRDDDAVLARVAHAYARTGQFERARESYNRLLQRAPQYTDQAVFDYLGLARRARARSDLYGMAGALEAALALRPGLAADEMSPTLARYYARTEDKERAREFFERALATAPPDSAPGLLFDYAQYLESQGDCGEAMELFAAFRTRESRGERADEARFHIGTCAFNLGRQARQAGDAEQALRYLQIVLDLGVPQNVLDQVWYERGEALLQLERRPEALEAFTRVLEHIRPPGGGQLADRARQRIDQLRFGRDTVP